MADDQDTPPPLPDSPPPPPLEESQPPLKKRRTSDKIRSLQKLLSESGGGMYMDSSSSAPPPNKTTETATEESISESGTLSHLTKSRPKRKVRPPSRSSVKGSFSQDSQTSLLVQSTSILEDSELRDETMEDEPPPLPPMSAPPEPPPSLPSPGSSPELSDAESPKGSPRPTTSTPLESTAQPLLKPSWSEVIEAKPPESPENTPKTASSLQEKTATSSTPSTLETKAIVIGSFSDRLKKLRERRAAKANASSSLSSADTPTNTPAFQSTVNSTKGPSLFSSSFDDTTPKHTHTKEEPVVNTAPTASTKENVHTAPSKAKVEPQAPSKEDDVFESDDDLPPAPPPPVPDLPPPDPPEDREDISTDTQAKPYTLTSKVSFRTLQRKDEWKRKSEQLQLDSFKSDNLPVFGFSSATENSPPIVDIPETRPEADEVHIDKTSSSESLPSLPDTLPPALPDSPPPTLLDAPPPDPNAFQTTSLEELPSSIQNEPPINTALDTTSPPSFRQLETSTPNSESTQDYSLSVVKLRHKKTPSPVDPGKRRSAFDALVTVEPTAEEKSEPKLTLEERRKLAIMASRTSNANTDTVHSAWTKQTNSSTGTPTTSTPDIERSEPESLNSRSRDSEPSYSMDSLKADWSQPTSKSESPEVRLLRQAPLSDRPSSAPVKELYPTAQETTLKSYQKEQTTEPPRPLSLPPGAEQFQQIRVISEGTPPSSPDVKYTRVGSEKWAGSPKAKEPRSKNLTSEDDLAASASTGNIIDAPAGRKKKKKKPQNLQKTSSLNSLGSSSESLKTGFSLPWLKFKKSSSKKAKSPHPMSPLAATSVTTPPSGEIPKSPTTLSLDSDDSNDESPAKSSSQEIKRSKFKIRSKFFSSTPKDTPSTFTGSRGSVGSKDNILSQQTPGRDEQAEERMEQQLARVKEQGKMTIEFLKKDPLAFIRSLTPSGSPMLRPASMILGTDIYRTDPPNWTVDQVCKWLELVGLGSFRDVFREGKINGKRLVQLDFFDELGIDSPEIREIFLAKIYELNNPSTATEELEDDFRLSVDDYTSDDWRKFEAAVNALKSNVYDDTIELEPSAIGQFIHTGYVRSQSIPDFLEMDSDQEVTHESDTSDQHVQKLPTSKTTSSFDTYMNQGIEAQVQDSDILSPESPSYLSSPLQTDTSVFQHADGEALTTEWVAGLPNVRRKRALTEPTPTINIESVEPRGVSGGSLPRRSKLSAGPGDELRVDPKRRIIKKKSLTPKQLSINEDEPLTIDPLQISMDRRSRASSDAQCCLVKLFMNTVQEGALYKSFLIAPTTTSDDLVAMALDKAYLGDDHNPQNYTIWDRDSDTTSRSSFSRQLKPQECPVVIQSQWESHNKRFFELRLKEGIQLHPTPQKRKMSAAQETGDIEAQIRALTEEKNRLLKELSALHSQLQDHKDLERQLESTLEECASIKVRSKNEQLSQNRVLAEMQGRIQQLEFENTKLEDQIAIMQAASSGDVSSKVLIEMQSKYTKTGETFTRQLNERVRENEELVRRNTTLEEELTEFRHASDEQQKLSRLLREHQQQLKTVEQKLAEKEDTIHSLRTELEQSEMSAKHAVALQETLQAVESTSKQHQDLSSRTTQELREQVSRLTAEVGHKEQQVVSLKRERDRLTREQQAKDNVATSLEADLDSYRALHSAHTSDNERILTLQRSVSVHEVALASLQSEYDRQREELREAEKDVTKLRDSLAKKEEQLTLLSSSQEHSTKSSLYVILNSSTAHQLILAKIPRSDSEGRDEEFKQTGGLQECYGLKVSGLLSNCIVSEVTHEVAAAGIQTGDRLLEINGTSVAGMSQREINTILKKHSKSQENPLKVVIARLTDTTGGIDELSRLAKQGSVDEELIERYKKLNASLNHQLDSQAAEVDRWRNECDRLKGEILKYSSLIKERDSEFTFLQSSVQDLTAQLEESERTRVQLRDTLDRQTESEGAIGERLREREKELVSLVEATEKAATEQIRQLEAENKKLISTLREYLVNTEESPPTQDAKSEELATASRSDILSQLAKREEELTRQTSYLEQLLSIVIDQEPQLLSKVGDAQRMRDQIGEPDNFGDSWC